MKVLGASWATEEMSWRFRREIASYCLPQWNNNSVCWANHVDIKFSQKASSQKSTATSNPRKPHESHAISKASVGVTLRPSVTALLVRTTWEILGGTSCLRVIDPGVICWCFFFGFGRSHTSDVFPTLKMHKQKSFGGSQSYLVEMSRLIFIKKHHLGGGNSNIFWNFHPELWGRWTHFDEHIFQMGYVFWLFAWKTNSVTLPETNSKKHPKNHGFWFENGIS